MEIWRLAPLRFSRPVLWGLINVYRDFVNFRRLTRRPQGKVPRTSSQIVEKRAHHAVDPRRSQTRRRLTYPNRNFHRNRLYGPHFPSQRLHGKQRVLHAWGAHLLAQTRKGTDFDRHPWHGTHLFQRRRAAETPGWGHGPCPGRRSTVHWHGATNTTIMAHTAISLGGTITESTCGLRAVMLIKK
jgi:hypothetical protein